MAAPPGRTASVAAGIFLYSPEQSCDEATKALLRSILLFGRPIRLI